ncbi:PREDICTED: uncharacterized protein LOC108795867 [Nanorana parkeri]|uniref:uncharacterized protein LOC108795867 n=1 Tax=Nanorana parkeri TaxID=125878 RepID=UPI000854848B|nr:PREDICTED: uncharacterized protein LOC108795867 [Nanorana parkeri]
MSSTSSGVSVSPSVPGPPAPTSDSINDTKSHPTSSWSHQRFSVSKTSTSATVTDSSLIPATTSTSGHPLEYILSPSPQTREVNRAYAKVEDALVHDFGTLLPSLNDSYTTLNTSKAPELSVPSTSHSDFVYQLADVGKLPFEKREHAGETDYELQILTECSLNGLNNTNGSIYVADEDFCLQCECLRSEIYCRAETHLSTGLCCQGCHHLFRDPCSKENNQIYSEQDEVQEICKCQNVFLQCRTCSSNPDCTTQDTSQRSESEHKQKPQMSLVRLVIKGMLNLWDEISSP